MNRPQKYVKPTLYHKGRKGAIYQWTVWSEGSTVYTEYGQVGGKMQISSKVSESTNDGRSNARDPIEQAKFEVDSTWQYQIDRKYRLSAKEASKEIILPMLAQSWDKHRAKVNFPVYIQKKYDGLRMMAFWDGDSVKLMSRSGKPYNHPKLVEALEKCLPKNYILDGELYKHGVDFQTLTSWAKKVQPETDTLEYHVYDYIDLDKREEKQTDRINSIKKLFANELADISLVVLAETYLAKSDAELNLYHEKFVESGYEGAIVRLPNGIYEFGYRSPALLKLKKFMDDDYVIVDVVEGIGKFVGTAIFVCETVKKQRFQVVMKASMDDRKKMYHNREKLIGEYIKVKFFEKTNDGLPRFPVGLGFRDKIDMD